MRIYRFGWKGVLFNSDAWLYAESGTPGLLFAVLFIALYIPSLFLSYLKVTTTGLELHYWPLYRVFAAWDEVERLGTCKALIVFSCDALYLKRPAAAEKNAKLREWGLAKKCIVPLSDFRAWPSGELRADLLRHIPHVFQ